MSNQKPNAEIVSALFELCGVEQDARVDALAGYIPHQKTRAAVAACAGEISSKTLENVAKFFNEHWPLKLTAAELVDPPELLLAVVRGLLDRAPAPAVAVHKTQNDALAALCASPNLQRGALGKATVRVVAFTLDKLIEQVQDTFLTRLEIGAVDLYLGSASVAHDLQSTRQAELIHQLEKRIDDELTKHNDSKPSSTAPGAPRAPVRGSNINEYRYRCAPTFQGWLIPNVVVCVAPLGWFPTFHGIDNDPQADEIKERYKKKHIHPNPDEHALNGWMMPHTQAFHVPGADNTHFCALQEQFLLFTDAHRVATAPQ